MLANGRPLELERLAGKMRHWLQRKARSVVVARLAKGLRGDRSTMPRRLREPDGRLEESTDESSVGPYHAGCRTNVAYFNLATREKCLTKIGGKAGRHCGDVVGIVRIGVVAAGHGAPAPPQPLSPKSGRSVGFSQTQRVLSHRGTSINVRPRKESQCGCGLCVPRMNSRLRLTLLVVATAVQCCDPAFHSSSSDVAGTGALA
jgi:hypothetical protein